MNLNKNLQNFKFLKDLHLLVGNVLFLCTLSQKNVDILVAKINYINLKESILNFPNLNDEEKSNLFNLYSNECQEIILMLDKKNNKESILDLQFDNIKIIETWMLLNKTLDITDLQVNYLAIKLIGNSVLNRLETIKKKQAINFWLLYITPIILSTCGIIASILTAAFIKK